MSTVRASHILLMYKGSSRSTAERSKEDAEALMKDIESKVAAGDSFANLAEKHSDCPSGKKGGDLGKFGRGQMVPAFDEVAFDLRVGTVSGVVETDFGYHLIQRTE